LSLGRVEQLLARLDHPERRLPPVIHVAGTNGKGSVIAFLRAMLEAAGHRVHVYTSPHLVRFHERIRLAGQLIDEAELVALLEECEAANGGEPITYFEITTVAALLAFARHPADVVLLETGLGGRLDATNVVARPRLAVITPVSIDHVQYLGQTVADIAFEKAGILKPGVETVVAPQMADALAVIERQAAKVGAPLRRGGADWRFAAQGEGFRFESGAGSRLCPKPALLGPHQIENAACAVACAERLAADFGLDETTIATGLRTVQWPGRMQRLQQGRLAALVPEGWELWLDGAHNAAAGDALARVIRAWDGGAPAGCERRPLHMIFSMLNTKAAEDFLRPLVPLASSLHALAIPGVSASLTADEAVAHVAALGHRAIRQDSLQAALDAIIAGAHAVPGTPGRILICGSLYLVGHVLAENG
jgi:dihydrofolate synthase/folylpolyglutamate synthase